jgi:hypothetical protein
MEATKEAYLANMDKTLSLGKRDVTVCKFESTSQSGSYERGFKWTYTTYGYLTCRVKKTKYFHPMMYSFDHGARYDGCGTQVQGQDQNRSPQEHGICV